MPSRASDPSSPMCEGWAHPPRDVMRFLRPLLLASLLLSTAGCPTARSPESRRPPKAQKWFERSVREFRAADIDGAHDSIRKALDLVPKDAEVRVLAARIALARLELDEAVRLVEGVNNREANSIRGRAHWYKGDLDAAAQSLDKLLDDPDVEDPWAQQIVKLASRGKGRKPFDISMSEGAVAPVLMAKVAGAPLFVVPVEVDGEQALGLVSTGTAEVMLDSSTRSEPSWVSLRFGKRLEVRDVPALTQDLTKYSMQLGAPIKALLGANLLRHLNVTLDLSGRQFVARAFTPPPPPVASPIDVWYLRGGGMVMGLGGAFGDEGNSRFFVDSSMTYSLALDAEGWQKVGLEVDSLKPLSVGEEKWRVGAVPKMQLGAFSIPDLPAVYGPPIEQVEEELDVDVDGMVGAGLLANFRVTFSDSGRVLWIEERPRLDPNATIGPDLGPPPGPDVPDVLNPGGGLAPPGSQGGPVPMPGFDPNGGGNLLVPPGGMP